MSKRKRLEQESQAYDQDSYDEWIVNLDEIAARVVHKDALCTIIEYLEAPDLLRISKLQHKGWSDPIELTLPRVFRNHFPFVRVDSIALIHAHGTQPPSRYTRYDGVVVVNGFSFTKHFQTLMHLSS